MTGIMQMILGTSGGPSGPLIPGVTYTFTPYGQTGPYGPTQSQANSYWSSKPEIQTALTVTNGINAITLSAGTYSIDMLGASGGATANPAIVTTEFNSTLYTDNIYGGVGARIQATFTLTTQTTIYIVVGQKGLWGQYPTSSSANFSGGGGGATFLYVNSSTPIAIAGGGGGAGGSWNSTNYGGVFRCYGGSATTTSNHAWVTSNNPSTVYDVQPNSSYTDAFSGGSWNATGYSPSFSDSSHGYGRALNSGAPYGGIVFANPSGYGPAGRPSARDINSTSTTVPREYTIDYIGSTGIVAQQWGGFGGGGGGYGNYGSGGGGGGYSSGAGFMYQGQTTPVANRAGGGGGSSYYNATYISGQTITAGDDIYNSTYYGDGYFKITKI